MDDQEIAISFWKKLIGSRYIGLFGLITGIVSIFLSIFFYYENIKEPELIYVISPIKTKIFKAKTTTSLTISIKGKNIVKDVNAIQIALWNRGKKSIRPENIIQPVEIYSTPKVEIIDASIRNISREIINFSLENNNFEDGIVKTNWKILEENDGASIQIIYIGPEDVDFNFRGTIEGQREIKHVGLKLSGNIPKKDPILSIERLAHMLIIFGILTLVGYVFIKILRKKRIISVSKESSSLRLKYTPLFLLVTGILYLIVGILIFSALPPTPPFPF